MRGRSKRGADDRSEPSRRHFCRILFGGAGAAALLFGAPWVRKGHAAPAELAVVQGGAAVAARRAVDILGGMRRFVRPGQRVVVKPNIGFDRVPEQAANTNPDVVAEVVRMALEAQAGEVRVFDRTSNDPQRCYRASGIEAALRAIGDPRVKVFHPDPLRYVNVAIPGAVALPKWSFYEDAVRADVFVNCPVAKHHSMTGLSLGMKNLMGIIGGDRSNMHKNFEDKIADITLARPSHLTILDATRVLRAHGPNGGSLLDVARPGIVVAGVNVVAVDSYATRLFEARPSDIPHLARAASRGLGPADLSRVELVEQAL